MGKLSQSLLIVFEVVNEMFVAVGAGVLGMAVLFKHGMESQQMLRSLTVVMITFGSFLYVCRQPQKTKPSKRKVVFITGCDSGLGYSLAQHASDAGFTVIATFLSLDSKGAQDIRQIYGDAIVQVQLDLTDAERIKIAANIVQSYLDNHPNYELYAIVNNAGVMIFGEFEWQTERLIQQQVAVNLLGTFNVTKAFCPLLRQHKGRIITVTSHCAQATLPGLAVYGATKAALSAWSDGIRMELGKYGVKVVMFLPGSFVTESNIMAKQLQNIREMHDSFTTEQHDFYSDYFKRYNVHLTCIGCPSEPKKLQGEKLYKTFDNALMNERPHTIYKLEPFRYTFYHYLFKFCPSVYLRDYFMDRFMQMPKYIPPNLNEDC